MVKRPKRDDETVEAQAVDPAQLTFRCVQLCPEPMDCTLPTPWPPVPAPGAQSAKR